MTSILYSWLHILSIISTAEEQHIDPTMCIYCRQTPCVTTDSREHLGFREAHVQNHCGEERITRPTGGPSRNVVSWKTRSILCAESNKEIG